MHIYHVSHPEPRKAPEDARCEYTLLPTGGDQGAKTKFASHEKEPWHTLYLLQALLRGGSFLEANKGGTDEDIFVPEEVIWTSTFRLYGLATPPIRCTGIGGAKSFPKLKRQPIRHGLHADLGTLRVGEGFVPGRGVRACTHAFSPSPVEEEGEAREREGAREQERERKRESEAERERASERARERERERERRRDVRCLVVPACRLA